MQQLRDPNAWRQAYFDTRNFLSDNADVIISTLPFVGELYDLASAVSGRDLITGWPLSNFEKTLVLAGVAAGVVTFGLGDEAIDLGADLLRHMDDIDTGEVMKAGRGLSRVDEAVGAVRAENRLAREALVKADIGAGLNRADGAVQTRLRNLPVFTGGNNPCVNGYFHYVN